MDNLLPVFKLLLNDTVYTKYGQYVQKIIEGNKELKYLYKHLENLKQKFPNRDITAEEFSLYVTCNCLDKDRAVLTDILDGITNTEADSVVLEDVLNGIIQRQKAYDLAIAALEVSEGKKEFDDLLLLVNNLDDIEKVNDDYEGVFVTDDLEELLNETIRAVGFRWRLQALNRMLGSLRRGDFGFIFARPETGKTTFLASEITNFATQLASGNLKHTGPILWFNNEERGEKVKLRLYQSMLGATDEQLESNPQAIKRKYLELGGSYIKIFDSASIHRKQVERFVRELEPSMVIFDQIDKIKGFADDREDLRLGSIYIWAREIAKQYCPVIAVCQADGSGEGKKWLTMDNVANAKTAKQAEADWIIGIGKTHNETEESERFINVCKNKLTGDADSDPSMRHGRATVQIAPLIGRYLDI